jgi:hypothetical protein
MFFTLLSQKFMRPVLFVTAIFTLTMALLPKPPKMLIEQMGDKLTHMSAFATLAVLSLLAFRGASRGQILERLGFFGALIEVFQSIPALHRTCDPLDWLADCSAVALVLVVDTAISRFYPHAVVRG